MTSLHDATITTYIRDILSYIPRMSSDRQRIKEDLRAHLVERLEAGNSAMTAITAMGDPKEVAASYLGERPLHYAPLGRRMLAAMLDYALIVGVTIVASIIALNLSWGLSGERSACAASFAAARPFWGFMAPFWMRYGEGLGCIGDTGVLLWTIGLFEISSMVYFGVAEAGFGQTIGKRLFGLTVITESGLAIGAKEAIVRRLPYIFQGTIVLDAVFMFIGQKRQRVFDRVARTVVVRTSGLTRP